MKHQKIIIACIISLIFSFSFTISKEKINLKDYYFPTKYFIEPHVYTYREIGGKLDMSFHWVMSTEVKKRKKYFTTELYLEDDLRGLIGKVEHTKEKITRKGAKLITLNEIVLDKYNLPGESIGQITKNKVYCWNFKNYPISFEVDFPSPFIKTDKKLFTKTRDYTGSSRDYFFEGKSYPTITFKEKYSTTFVEADSIIKVQEFIQHSKYAKGLGMVSYKRIFEEKDTFHLELQSINTKRKMRYEWEKIQ